MAFIDICSQMCIWKLHPREAGYDSVYRGRPDALIIARHRGLKVSLVIAIFI